MIYLDNAATTQVLPEVIDLVVKYMSVQYGNTSSLHHMGLEAEKALRNSRGLIAKHLACQPEQLVFTSGATESNNWVIQRTMEGEPAHVIVSSVEHPSVLEPIKAMAARGWQVTYLPVDQQGRISIDDVLNSLQANTKLISVMLVNNEVGTWQPVEHMVKRLRSAGFNGVIHTDATQAMGKIKINLKHLDVDFLSLSGHKCHGPKGVGLLYQKQANTLKPFIYGGGQEANQRSGTHNLPNIVGLAKSIAISDGSLDANWSHVHGLRAKVVEILSQNPNISVLSAEVAPDWRDMPFNEHSTWAVPQILSIGIAKAKAEVVLHALEAKGIMVSSGSACGSNKRTPISHVVHALNLDRTLREGVIRISFSHKNTIDEVTFAANALLEVLSQLQFKR